MNDITSIYFVILVLLSSTVRSPAQDTSKDLGEAGCRYWGLLQDTCHEPSAPIDRLPADCTTFIYDGVIIDANNHLQDANVNGGATLDELIATDTKVMVLIGYKTIADWIKALDLGIDRIKKNAKEVTQSLKLYVDQHKGIKGFIFENMDGRDLSKQFTGNLKIYIDEIGKTFPDMAIGMNIESDALVYYIVHPKAMWLDFKILNPLFNFFVLQIQKGNNCTFDVQATGIFPLFPLYDLITIDSIVQYMKGVGIPTSKLHYHYQIYGETNDVDCKKYYPSICSPNKKKLPDGKVLCADTQQSLYDKGGYASLNGIGFVATIDVDDYNGICECGRPFPAFHALLDGFYHAPVPTGCHLLDRT